MADWKTIIKAAPKGAAGGVKLTPAQKLASNMDKALAAYKKGESGSRPTIKAVGDQVQFSVRYANTAIELAPGITIAQVPAVQFETVFAGIKDSALAGEFDKQLAPLAANTAERGKRLSASPRKPRAKAK